MAAEGALAEVGRKNLCHAKDPPMIFFPESGFSTMMS
jgi:hypothetical protein